MKKEIEDKFKTLVKKYIKWDNEVGKLERRISRIGWNAVYDLGGFKAVDKAEDIVVKYYNQLNKEGIYHNRIEFISDVENDLHILASYYNRKYCEQCKIKWSGYSA